jgi:hypothetical protein
MGFAPVKYARDGTRTRLVHNHPLKISAAKTMPRTVISVRGISVAAVNHARDGARLVHRYHLNLSAAQIATVFINVPAFLF